ncbi:cytochrome P450 [Hibiscus syriacus]|uniref:Cytochrome P450 n=1 Tax=Hibiscus syriacus TaxID=106335 RepID=A0A6A3CC40_HIBSY|nr:cytochrome P450 [Hibiscus syriacus]
MKVYLRFLGLWIVVETDKDPPELRPNPTLSQFRAHDEEMLKKDRVLTCIHFGLADYIFTSIMDLETPKSVWNKLKETYEGDLPGEKVVEKVMISFPQSGCSSHMTHVEAYSNSLDQSFKISVKLGNSAMVQVQCKGSICFNTPEVDDVESDETRNDFATKNTTDVEVIKTNTLVDAYERCNFIFVEPTSCSVASKNVIGMKWVYRTKFNPDGTMFKHKERLVVKGYAQITGVDYGDTFSLFARLDTIKLFIAITGQI